MGKRHQQVFGLTLATLIHHSMVYLRIYALWEIRTNFPGHRLTLDFQNVDYFYYTYLLGKILFLLPAAYYSHKWSNRKFLALGIALIGVCQATLPFISISHYAVCTWQFLLGLLSTSVPPCTFNLLSRWTPVKERSRMSACVTTSSVLGLALGAIFSQDLVKLIGWQRVFQAFGILNMGLALILLTTLYDSPSEHPSISQMERSLFPNTKDEEGLTSPPWREMLFSVPVWALIIGQFGVNWGTDAIIWKIPASIAKLEKLDHESLYKNRFLSKFFIINYVLFCVAGLLFGWISDFTINRGQPVAKIRKIFNSIGCWGPALILIAMAFLERHIPKSQQWIPMNVALCVAIILLAGSHAGAMVGVLDISPRYAGSLVSLITLVSPIFALNATDLWSFFLFHMGSGPDLFLMAGILFFSNMFYLFMGKGSVQPWNSFEEFDDTHTVIPLNRVH